MTSLPIDNPRTKPEPKRFCQQCGARLHRKRMNGRLEDLGVFTRRKYCDEQCSGLARRKTTLTRGAHQWRARQYKESACEQCGATEKLQVHHRDNDWRNDDPTNFETLCASCHMKEHWSKPGRLYEPRTSVSAAAFTELIEACDQAIDAFGGSPEAEALSTALKRIRGAKTGGYEA